MRVSAQKRLNTNCNLNLDFGNLRINRMPKRSSPKREREYKNLVNEFHESHCYPISKEEVAARIVNKQRREHGEMKDDNEYSNNVT